MFITKRNVGQALELMDRDTSAPIASITVKSVRGDRVELAVDAPMTVKVVQPDARDTGGPHRDNTR